LNSIDNEILYLMVCRIMTTCFKKSRRYRPNIFESIICNYNQLWWNRHNYFKYCGR